jgi:hypothetical protein
MLQTSLILDFTSAVLDARVTLTRALNTATVVNASGLIESVNANLPRFDYVLGSGLTCKGLLIEETRSNLLLNSVMAGGGAAPTSFTQPNATGTSAPVSSTRTLVGTAYRQTAASQRPYLQQVVSLAAATTYSQSMVVESVSSTTSITNNQVLGNGSGISITQYYANGVAVAANASVVPGVLTAVFTTAAGGNTNLRYGVGILGVANADLTFSCPQIEAGAFPTSYIPTTSAALTRNADVATITGTNFSDWWQAGFGGATVQALPSTVSGIRPLIQFDDGTANEIIALRGNTTNPELCIVDGGAPQAQIDAGTIAANTAYSLTGWWAANDCKARKDSGAVVTDTTVTIPTVTQARIGSDGSNYLNGTIATINYYDSFFGQPIYTRRKNKAVFTVI